MLRQLLGFAAIVLVGLVIYFVFAPGEYLVDPMAEPGDNILISGPTDSGFGMEAYRNFRPRSDNEAKFTVGTNPRVAPIAVQ